MKKDLPISEHLGTCLLINSFFSSDSILARVIRKSALTSYTPAYLKQKSKSDSSDSSISTGSSDSESEASPRGRQQLAGGAESAHYFSVVLKDESKQAIAISNFLPTNFTTYHAMEVGKV